MISQSNFYFNTVITISCDGTPQLISRAFELCDAFERLLSRFIRGSEVWLLNQNKGQPTKVEHHTQAILSCAEKVRAASGGAFNVAIGSVSSLWVFDELESRLPNEDLLEQARAYLATSHICIEDDVVTLPEGLAIDLGGIAKGYICDRIADFLRENGVSSGLLNFGGNIVAIGLHPEGRPWNIGLQTPNALRDTSIFAKVHCCDATVVTSGIYERAFVKDGRRYHHIIDPRTCQPVVNDILSVSVITDDSMVADALATAILVMGVDAGLALAEKSEVDAAILCSDNTLHCTPGVDLVVVDSGITPFVSLPLGERNSHN